MPSQSKANALSSKSKAIPYFDEPETAPSQPEQEPGTRVGRKKNKNASTKQHESPEKASESEIARDPSPFGGQSILGQLPRYFPAQRRLSNDDVLEELNTTEKVSDEHTPPQPGFLPNPAYGQSPPSELIPGLSYAPSPPAQYSYIGKGGFNTRSPPISPPQVKARPASYGGPPPSSLGYNRLSTSPYAHPMPAYGSPLALPHLPQPHFYNAQDIDLGFGAPPRSVKATTPAFLKFARFPGGGPSSPEALFVGSDAQLDILSYDSEKLDRIGSLSQLPGIVHDAVFLTWSGEEDPFADLRPLIAVSMHGAAPLEPRVGGWPPSVLSSHGTAPPVSYTSEGRQSFTVVVVYSLRKQTAIAELLRAPDTISRPLPFVPESGLSQKIRMGLQASGSFLIASSGVSGEVFVLDARQEGPTPTFECLTKFWTTLQPRIQRRDSSHSRPADTDMSPADKNRSQPEDLSPILSLNGRWLAFCPAAATMSSLGASLGDSVIRLNNSTIGSSIAPAQPTVSCEVESPDVDTLLSKVAKGAAQSILRGSKWLGEMGMQAWRNWNQDPLAQPPPPSHGSPVYSPQLTPAQFPPTHGESLDAATREPEIVSIVDLLSLQMRDGKKPSEPVPALATFQPPGGCSFVSFAPNGLCLLTANRKGDVQYVWDLLQLRYLRMSVIPPENDSGNFAARVRQLAKYERFSPSMIVDIQWEGPLGHRFATLTQNRTIHMFDLPASALRWPPPRKFQRPCPVSAPAEKLAPTHQPPLPSGFLASAMNLASRTQPMLANLRGRTPSVSGGVSGIGTSGIGLASATGMRGGKVVAAGFSKSLGAATDTVAHIRHAGQSKLHLKVEGVTGRMIWRRREQRVTLCVVDAKGVRHYFVRKTNPRQGQQETVSVFDARKAINHKLPDDIGSKTQQFFIQDDVTENVQVQRQPGFWKQEMTRAVASDTLAAPLSYAEIETNAPYQPFHSDPRVSMSVYSDDSRLAESHKPTVSVIFQPQGRQPRTASPSRWVFGGAIHTSRLSITPPRPEADRDAQESIVYRETSIAPGEGEHEAEQITSTTRRRKARKQVQDPSGTQVLADQEEFFEDESEVLDCAADRV